MTSLAFDRAAAFYDDTRGLPAEISERVTQTILDLAPASRPILECGVGTGRIAAPLLQRGAPLVGIDLSVEMMQRLHTKIPLAPLARADISRLPFPDATFGAILTVHVLHLVGPWRDALLEFRRVLAPGGVYLNSTGRRLSERPNSISDRWHERVETLGHSWRRPGAQSREEVLEQLWKLGAQIDEIVVATWTRTITPQQQLDDIARRIHSDTWSVPDDVLAETVAEVRDWAAKYGDLNQPIPIEREFAFDVMRF
jgi:ubiquinone/menaquinone biosynthesis C-methylase UbiE